MRALPSRLGLLGTVALASLPAPAGAQPVGSEFQINTYTTSAQLMFRHGGHAVAVDASGNFVVVWTSLGQDGSVYGIFAQRFDSGGAVLGSEFRVNSYTLNSQRSPSLASDANGNFVVVWRSVFQDGDGYGIFGQRYDSAGRALGSEFQVNSYTTNNQRYPSVASDASGNFVVVWDSNGQDGGIFGIFAQRYDSGGVAQGAEFRVNSYTPASQSSPDVASDADGNFVVVWESHDQDGHDGGIFGQRYDSGGTALGSEFQVNSYTTSTQQNASVASDASGNFIIVWESYFQDGSSVGIFGQRYDSAGVAQGGEFRVNSFTFQRQGQPSVASDASGNLVVVWSSLFQESPTLGVFGQRYDSAGDPQGGEFQINSYTTDYQGNPSVAAAGPNQFVVAWDSLRQDGSGWGVFGRRYDSAAEELLVNGGFEADSCDPWVFTAATNCKQGGLWPHSGTGYAQLGKNNSNGRLYQEVSIPPDAPAALTFWLNVDTHETTRDLPNDKLFVEVRDPEDGLLGTLGMFSNLDGAPSGVYSHQAFSMAEFAGLTVRLTLHMVSNASLPTIFRIDDASLQ